VCGHIAFSAPPFCGRLWENKAIHAGGEFLGLLATGASFHHVVAAASVKLATALAHEEAFNTLFYVCADHGYHVLSLRNSRTLKYSQHFLFVKKKYQPS
jgi:hypothetical protein